MAMASKSKRSKGKKRIQLGIIISREMKARIEAMARKSGQSQGQIAELLMMEAFAYKDLIAATRKGIEQIHKGNIEAELYRLGWTRIRTPDPTTGKVFSDWLEPGHPRASERGGFMPWKEGEQPPGNVTLREYEDGSAEVIVDDGSGEPEPER
jgi:hypothetical protein